MNMNLIGKWVVKPYAGGSDASAHDKGDGLIELDAGSTETERIAACCVDALTVLGREPGLVVNVHLMSTKMTTRARMRVGRERRVDVYMMRGGRLGGNLEVRTPRYGIVLMNDRRVPDLFEKRELESTERNGA